MAPELTHSKEEKKKTGRKRASRNYFCSHAEAIIKFHSHTSIYERNTHRVNDVKKKKEKERDRIHDGNFFLRVLQRKGGGSAWQPPSFLLFNQKKKDFRLVFHWRWWWWWSHPGSISAAVAASYSPFFVVVDRTRSTSNPSRPRTMKMKKKMKKRARWQYGRKDLVDNFLRVISRFLHIYQQQKSAWK